MRVLLKENKPGATWLGYHVPGRLSAWNGYLLRRMNDACNAGDPDMPATWPAIKDILMEIYQHRNSSYTHEISALGHCHIDTAWLWPLAETRRKCARSFSSAIAYMGRYPEYKFACSQAQQYQWIKDGYPELYGKIKQEATRGAWIPVGGTWIEPDCNLPSGESLIRQFLYGQRFFKEEFGSRCREFWNPDVFGYSGALPQIMKSAGIDYFLTQKLFWNQLNPPQYTSFVWRGIDGSEVLAHFPPAENYNALSYQAIVNDLLRHEEAVPDHDRGNEGLLLFGFGDGGGGPTPHMLEVLRRVHDFQGIPRTEQRDSFTFFQRLEKRLYPAPVIEGELYLELHRGTYTTQAADKLGNRRSEIVLRDAEMLATLSWFLNGASYPAATFEKLWKILLLHQFHDILPGTSIPEVHAESRSERERVINEGEPTLAAAATILVGVKLTHQIVFVFSIHAAGIGVDSWNLKKVNLDRASVVGAVCL